MSSMSNTRKDIAKRLGFAANNGAKTAFAQPNNDRAYAAILKQAAKVALDAWKLAVQKEEEYLEGANATSPFFVNTTKQRELKTRTQSAYELAKRLNPDYQGFARPGVKAKFADNDAALSKFLVKYKDNENNNYHSENVVLLANFVGSSSEIAQAKDILKKVRAAGHLPPDLNDEQYSLYKSLAAKLKSKYPGAKFSRPGAKAAMAADWKIGDAVHLGMGTVGGVGYNGIITKLDGDTVYIESTETDNKYGPRTFKGLVRYLSRNARPGAKVKFDNKRSIEIMLTDGKIPASAFSWEGNTLTVDPNYRDQIVSVLKSYVPWEIKSMPAMQLRASRPGAKAKMENSDGNYFTINGYVDNSIWASTSFNTQAEAEYSGKRVLEALKKSHPKAKNVNVQILKVVDYSPQKIKTLSLRPGAKAKFTNIFGHDLAEETVALYEERLVSYRKALANADLLVKKANSLLRRDDQQASNEVIGIARIMEAAMKSNRGFSRPGAKTTMAKPPRKYNHGDRVYIMNGNERVGSGVIDYIFDYDDFVKTYIYKVRDEGGGRRSYNETSLKKMSRPGAKAAFAYTPEIKDGMKLLARENKNVDNGSVVKGERYKVADIGNNKFDLIHMAVGSRAAIKNVNASVIQSLIQSRILQ